MQQLAYSQARQSRRTARPLLAAAVGLLGLGLGLGSIRQSSHLKKQWEKVSSRAKDEGVISLRSWFDVKFPWVDKELSEWQFKKVDMLGYYKPHRVVVARERNGKPGYYVFAPFITNRIEPVEGNQNIYEAGLVVNLGWLPKQDRSSIELGMEPTQPLEEISLETKQMFPHMFYDEDSDFYVPMHRVTGYLRKGQTPSLGKQNFPDQDSINLIDVEFLANRLGLGNMTSQSAYVELIGDDGEDAPIKQATATTFVGPDQDPNSKLKQGAVEGLLGAVSAAAILLAPI